jgi:hypothetical protein
MAITVRRDPFARGAFLRECKGRGCCAWCGQERLRVFSYFWANDGVTRPNLLAEWQRNHNFCNFDFFVSHNS